MRVLYYEVFGVSAFSRVCRVPIGLGKAYRASPLGSRLKVAGAGPDLRLCKGLGFRRLNPQALLQRLYRGLRFRV